MPARESAAERSHGPGDTPADSPTWPHEVKHDQRVTVLEQYLDSRFRGAFIRSIPSRSDNSDVVHTFIVETDDHTFALLVLRRFVTEFRGSMKRYLVEHNIWKVMREAEPAGVLVTPRGPAVESYRRDDWTAMFAPP